MALPTWPASLPQLRGLQQSAGTDALYTPPKMSEFDDGPERTRRRGLFRSTTLLMGLELTLVSLPIFQEFTEDALADGARRFTGPVLLPNGTIATRTCKIVGAVALRWPGPMNPAVSFPLKVWNWRA